MEPQILAEVDIGDALEKVLAGDYTLTISIEVPDVEESMVPNVLEDDNT